MVCLGMHIQAPFDSTGLLSMKHAYRHYGSRSSEESSDREKQNPPPPQQISLELSKISALFLSNIILHPVPQIFTALICEYSIQLKIRLLNCSFSTQQAAKL